MRLRIESLEDIEEARELHDLALPGDRWAGDHNDFWVARLDGHLAGLIGIAPWPAKHATFLSRAAVAVAFRGRGVYQFMLRHCIRWSMKQGADLIVTYTLLHNYESIGGLLRAGFRFVQPPKPERFVGSDVHYFHYQLSRRSASRQLSKARASRAA